jgi:cytochrome P450
MTEDELVGQLSFLIFAGFESTIHAVAFAAYLVAQHPEVAARLYEEVHGLLKGDAPTVDQLKALPYLDAVTKECLRLLSPVPFLIRTTQEEVELGGYLLPPRTEIMLSIYHTHRMSAIYTDPNRFQPERWASIEPSTYEYLPFSVGPHMCAGWALALMEMKVLLSMFVQRFRLDVRPTDRIDRRVMATMGPRPGMFLNVHRQDKNFAASRAPVVGQLARMVEIPFA